MDIKRFGSNGRMSRVVEHGGMIFLSGITAGQAGEDVKSQTTAVLETITDVLKNHGSDKQHILSATIYLRDMADFAGMNSVWDSWVSQGSEPARATVEAKLAAPTILVEISITAAIK